MEAMKRWRAAALLLLPALLAQTAALAQSTCTSLSITGLMFGSYTGAAPVATTATLTVTCPAGLAYMIGVNGGDSGNSSARTMEDISSGAHLSYGLYQDSAHTILLGDASGVTTIAGTGTGSAQSYTVYGLMAAGQNGAPGSYADHPVASVAPGTNAYQTFIPQVTVSPSCAVAASSLQFGAYAGTAVAATTSLSVTCTDTTPYNIGLSAGSAAGATVSTRAMTGSGPDTLAYQLFQDSAHTANWGDTIASDTVAGAGTGIAQTLTVYGYIAAGQFVSPGVYTDTITVTVTY
jgi:spore coat protein U-like protein